jgi:hypothetical protein
MQPACVALVEVTALVVAAQTPPVLFSRRPMAFRYVRLHASRY